MSLRHVTDIDLPEHLKEGGFDHAAAHRRSARLYVAHTANDAVDVIDCGRDCYLYSIPDLPGVAGGPRSRGPGPVLSPGPHGKNTGMIRWSGPTGRGGRRRRASTNRT